jgi:type II secretory pathway pseudopilin PulG
MRNVRAPRLVTLRRLRDVEDGFSLVEGMVSLAIITLILTALLHTQLSTIRTVHDARLVDQATALGNEAVEDARNFTYDDLVMLTSDLTGDPNVEPGNTLDPDAGGPMVSESLVRAAAGAPFAPHVTQETLEGVTFTISRYLTWVDTSAQGGADEDVKRVVVIVDWQTGGEDETFRTSALLARSRTGLGTTRFEVSPMEQEIEVEPGNQVVLAHAVTTLGINDTYNLEMPVPPGRGWVIQFHEDANEDGVFDGGADPLLTDTNFDGIVDTGGVDTNVTFHFLVVWTLIPAEPLGDVDMTLSVTSGARPDLTVEAVDTVDIGSPSVRLYLHNNPTPPTADTTAQANMTMTETAPSAGTLRKYSTNYYTNQAGRYVDKKVALHTETGTQFMANWVYQVPSTTTYTGTAELTFWVAMKDLKCDKTPQVTIFLRDKATATSGTGTLFATAAATSPPPGLTEPCDFREVTVSIPVNRTISTNRWIELKITTAETTGDAALVAYDTTVYPSSLTLPFAST